jgi:hypothetical protein
MREMPMQNVVFKFRRPSGSGQQEPSMAMTEALQRLSETVEMQPLLAQASKNGKTVAIEVFHSRDGHAKTITSFSSNSKW